MCRNTTTPMYTFNREAARLCRKLTRLYRAAHRYEDCDEFRATIPNCSPLGWGRFRVACINELVWTEGLFEYDRLLELLGVIEEALGYVSIRNASGRWETLDPLEFLA